MKKLIIIVMAVICCSLFLSSCKKDPNEHSNVQIIPTIKISEPGEIWASDMYISPEDITENVKQVRIEKGTKLGEWVCPATGIYQYEQIKDYLK